MPFNVMVASSNVFLKCMLKGLKPLFIYKIVDDSFSVSQLIDEPANLCSSGIVNFSSKVKLQMSC